jgi:hypothetical protein
MSHVWFELSQDGWRRLHAGRPLGTLLREAIQNAFDEDVTRVEVTVDGHGARIADNGLRGFADERLIYTIFLTDKAASPERRGRQGRGLKELVSAFDRATVETVGLTVRFDTTGRNALANNRTQGTLLTLEKPLTSSEVEAAAADLRVIIPPLGVELLINGTSVARPAIFATLPECVLDTVIADGDVERVIRRRTMVTLYVPRELGDKPHIFEMGIPVSPAPTPWHLDVGQRIPRETGQRAVDADFRLQLLATLFESMVGGPLTEVDLREAWVMEVLSEHPVSASALKTFAMRRFPPRAVLPADAASNDRARQEGAVVVDVAMLGRGVTRALTSVMETSDRFLKRRSQAAEVLTAVTPDEDRVVAFYATLAKRILDKRVLVRLIRRAATSDGYIEDATFDRERNEMRINVLGKLDVKAPLSAVSLGIFLHELAHAFVSEHDMAFIEALQEVSGRAARILARDGPTLVEQHGLRI